MGKATLAEKKPLENAHKTAIKITKEKQIITMKGVAIPYIIALILGIIVLGMVAYWFITTYGLGWLGFNEAFCRAQLSKYCEDLIAGKTSVDFFKDYAKGCEVFQGKAGWPAVSPTVDECPKWR